MMATEPKVEISEASVPSDPEPATQLDAEPRDGDAPAFQLNGTADEPENKHISDVAEDLVHSAEVSISGGSVGGSDTEASKTKDDKGHVRTSSSVKKPTGFKSVSVNKTFLAAKGAASSTAPKVGDKLAPSPGPSVALSAAASSAARPRLVAKSASLRDAASRSSSANGKPGAAPDASAVWNKNRPPEPKKFTDEELKKYGIHMASRLQADESKGQANWADIEDDDDDWAPETITWTDGTKITIPHADEHPPTPAVEKAVPVAPQAAAPSPPPVKEIHTSEKPKSPAPPAGSPATKPSPLPSGRGLILKGAPEKPSLVAKPPAPPTPVKSPWAPIPRVETVSPMIPDRTANQSPSRMPHPRDGHHIPKGVTPPPPTKEIAADDFSRSPWRDGPGHGNRELFNSQSGRYEPVTDRRASTRPDTHSRQPAVLQRSSHHETQGPAEPSAAFQTTHSSANFPRRRASSNVSGGSGSFLRLGRPHEQPELLDPRRGSFTADSESPASPRNFSPSGMQGGPRAHGNPPFVPRASPAVVHATPHLSPAVSEAAPVPPEHAPEAPPREDDYEYQKKLMRERRELAMKRRLEQEAKEEAERKERIRLKLEAMGPAPERKSAKKEAATKEQPSAPTHIQSRENPPQGPPHVEVKADDASEAAAAQTIPSTAENKAPSLPNGSPSPASHAQPSSTAEPALPPPDSNKHGHPWPGRMPSQADRFTWGPGSQAPRNVWGSPNNDRSLGNGTFNADLARLPDAHASALPPARAVSGPGPIAPPSSAKASPGEAPLSSRPAPIGPPPSSRSRRDGAPQRGSQPQPGLASAWIAAVQQTDAELAVQKRDKNVQRERELEARGLTHADIQGTIQDTWRPTKLDEKGQRVSTQEIEKVVHGSKPQPAGASWVASPGDRQAPDAAHRQPAPIVTPSGPSPVPQHPRGSRFFPARDARNEDNAASTSRPHSPSPPPPDMAGHPAFDGDAAHPHVALPPTKPVVRLPPAPGGNASTASQRQPNFNWSAPQPFRDPGVSHAHPSRPSPAGHHVPHGAPPAGENWQDRINNLLTGRKPSPPKPVAVDSASRHALAPSIQHVPATVSLPSPSQAFFTVDNGQITTKVMDEDCFEAQEMGSLPQIRIPQKTPEALWQPALPPKPIPRRFVVATPTSAEPVRFVPEGGTMRVWMPGMSEAKNVALPNHRSRSNPRRGRSGPRYASATQRPGAKGRDPSSSYHPSDHGPSAPHSGRGGGRGGFRGRGDNWSRHASTPIQT